MTKITINEDSSVKITTEVVDAEISIQSFASLFVSSGINFIPDNCCSLGIVGGKQPFVVIEQKPRVQTVAFNSLSGIRYYRIFFPWTYYRVPFISGLEAESVRVMWSAKKVNDLSDKIFVVPLPTQRFSSGLNRFGVYYCNASGGIRTDISKPIHEQVSEAVSNTIASRFNYPNTLLTKKWNDYYGIPAAPEFLIPQDEVSQAEMHRHTPYCTSVKSTVYLKHYEDISEKYTEEELLKMFQEFGEEHGYPYAKFLGKTT